MEFLGGVGLIVAALYLGMHGHPGAGGALMGLAVVTMGGGLWRRRQTGKPKD